MSTDALLADDLREELAGYVDLVEFEAGECIFREGSPSDCCYLLDAGEVRIEVQSHEVDTDAVLGYMSPPSILGELGLLDGLPRSATALAESPVAGRRLSADGLQRLCEELPVLGAALLRTLGRDAALKLRRTTERVAEQVLAGQSDAETDRMVSDAVGAQREFATWPEQRVDELLGDIADSVAREAEHLAAATVAETGMGNVADKTAKNRFAALRVYESIAGRPASGPLVVDRERRVTEVAAPVGVVFGLIPLTNPVATIVNKALICLKARNALILSCHRGASGVGAETGALIRGICERHGAPPGLLQLVSGRTSRQRTNMFMRHPDVALILATGGPGMVKAAYSAGKPAIGVGSGNAPALICADADPEAAARAVVSSKTFDHGVICGSEQHLVVERPLVEAFTRALKQEGAAVLDRTESETLVRAVFESGSGALLKRYAGRPAQEIADAAGVARDVPIRLLVFQAPEGEMQDGPASRERLAPLLSLFAVESFDAGLDLCRRLLAVEGAGHTAAIHTRSSELAQRFGVDMPVSRILVNLPAAQGCVGMGNGLTPSLTLGCGTFGGNSTTDNVGYLNLLNIKRIAEPLPER
jgi:acyl-CoA reductase-like NAD-dependent aldehyde dehydrogenase